MQISWFPQFLERLNTIRVGRSTLPNVRLEITSHSDRRIFISSMNAGSFWITSIFFSGYERIASAKAHTSLTFLWSMLTFGKTINADY